MNPLSVTRLGWLGFARMGLAFLVCGLAVGGLIDQFRVTFPPRIQAPAPARRPIARIPDGPPMRIDLTERERAGRERADNGLGMRFCWCPPGSFPMGGGPRNRYGLWTLIQCG
ncbi:hypothetical protein SAMN05444166_5131 [Singulisphaera sp. GP187]|uniref:hypothetical protein n=1 Tax=Singulisphaera sp. GP187 TaxID=1882752 RepID=UPI00092B4296|nr:hypothetical protein [Singulisphaera sp. GP187]SIO55711.1 hypothetical protein SAMN05444166_5131 [Singulisphaera sp. GP187]